MSPIDQIQISRRELPIFSYKEQLIDAFKKNKCLVIVGETGSGKTTQIPQYLEENKRLLNIKGMIGITQPRRVAAVSLANRVAEEQNTKVGDKVGYSIRFDDKTSQNTAIKYLTDGMLLREVLSDPLLRSYSVVILDEAHERTLRTDILFGLLKGIQKIRQELRIIIMSATLDAEKFSQYFNNAKIFHVRGRQFPVRLLATIEPQKDYIDSALTTILQIHLEHPKGDVLVFLTGQEDIESVQTLLESYSTQLPQDTDKLIICPLFANLPTSEQTNIFTKTPNGCRKVILATNIAETSLTIPGIRYVVDSGLHKMRGFHPKLGIETLMAHPISKSSARQRAGRAGRDAPGTCFRLYTDETFQELNLVDTPEIARCSMSSTVLLLKASGVNDVINFDYLDRPSRDTLFRALVNLYVLGAINDDQQLTTLGKQMSQFPLEPMFAKVLIKSLELSCMEEVISIIAMLSVENVFYTPQDKREESAEARKKFISSDGDHITLLNVIKAYMANNQDSKWCRSNFINARAISSVLSIRRQLLDLANKHAHPSNRFVAKNDVENTFNSESDDLNIRILKSFVSGFAQNIAIQNPDKTFKTLLTNQPVYLHPSSSLFMKFSRQSSRKLDTGNICLLYNELVFTTKKYMRGCSIVEMDWIVKSSPQYYGKLE